VKTQNVVGRILTAGMAVLFATTAKADYQPADAMRFTTWNPGLMSVGGIPTRTTVSTTINASSYGNGSVDASSAIQAAIDACRVGDVVRLSAGTFTVNSYLLIKKAITLRGAGPGQTILQKTNGAVFNINVATDAQPILILGAARWPKPDSSTSQNLTVDVDKGAMSVTIANGSGFTKGQFVLLDELSGASWQTERLGHGQVWASPDFRVVWKLHNPAIQYGDDPLEATTPTGGGAASWFCRQDRPVNEIKEIAGVSGNVVTFTSPLHINYRSGTVHQAQLTRYVDGSNGGNGGALISYAGVEDLTTTGASDGSIRFECAAYSWAKNVEVKIWGGEGIAVNNSFRCEIRDSYIHDAAYSSPGGGAYAFSMADGSSEILF